MLNEDIIVQRSIMPFRRDFETLRLQDCKTPREMINKLVPFNFVDCKLIVTVDNEILPPDSWDSYELKKGQLVGLNYIPTGGGGGKNTLMLVGVIAAAIAVPALAGMAATAVGNAAVGAGIGGFTGLAAGAYALTYGAVMIGGSMLLSMASSSLMSVPKQNAGSGQRESTSQYVEGAQNSINKYGIVPIVLGTNRMFPPQAALPFTESSDNNQYCRQLFTYGYGKVQLSDRRLGETSIDDFDEVEMDDRLDADLNQGTKLYTNDVYQENLSLKITKEDSPFVRTTQQNCNEAEIDITFQGLCYINDSGGRDNRTVEFEIQYALSGTEDWTVGVEGLNVTESQTLTVDLSNTYEAPKHKVMGVGVGARRKHVSTPGYQINTFIVLNVEDGTVSTVTTRSDADSVVYPSLTSNMVILGYIDGHSLAYVDRRSYLTDSYISSADDFPVTISGSGASTQVTVGAGTIVGGVSTLTVTDATQQSLRKVKRIVFPSRGQYDIKITRLTDDSEDTRLVNDSYWTALRSITYQDPVKFADISGTAIRIKATDQLNGNISSYNAIVSALIKSYNRETDTWEDDKPSSNPADIFRYVLQSPAFAKHDEITDDRIDLAKLKEWWIYCDEIGLTFDRIIDYDTSIDDVLNDVCAAGVATLSKVNNIYSVIIDNERPYIKGLVTPRNSWDYKGSINYPDLPHALRVEFRNPDVGYETDERIVYMDGYDESNATLYERLQFESCTDENLAYWYGRRYFATALLQPETHSFKMDFEHLTFQRGDRIKFINDGIEAVADGGFAESGYSSASILGQEYEKGDRMAIQIYFTQEKVEDDKSRLLTNDLDINELISKWQYILATKRLGY